MFCKKCGKELPEGATICPECGTAVEKENVIVVKQIVDEAKPVSVKTGLGCAITAFVLCTLGCLFLIFPLVGIVFYYIFASISFCFVIPGFIVSLIRIIKKQCLGKAITSMCFTIVSLIGDVIFYIIAILVLQSA